MLSEQEVEDLFPRARDQGALVRGLRKAGVVIGLRHEERRIYPAFQFRGARPHPIVAAVNLLLGADRDPWSATWWIRDHPRLGNRPLDLLQRADERDRLLIAAELHVEPAPEEPARR